MPRRPWSSRLREDQGSATAETAIVLPVVVAMVAVLLVAGLGIGAQVRLESAARGAARELARGEDPSTAAEVAQRLGGEGTTVSIGGDGSWVRVEARRTYRADAPLLGGAHWELRADAQAHLEPQLLEGGAGGGGPGGAGPGEDAAGGGQP
ncbi:TadE family type IV pilus minor pilin [Brachybacterium rhamnosum]|uniref:TadE family type IV pilus minor pilin n=1 Tax=Brachybacterium rhamnosum TaxID=173361 RepID=A0ABW4Q0B4_9MICO|nr:TadE family type IV pilus minor pilin [Brachybacterium sp. SGAir0954]QCR53128.1 hypothetical protein C1N80_05720 [Brachybacterium sp. SGAir0954]